MLPFVQNAVQSAAACQQILVAHFIHVVEFVSPKLAGKFRLGKYFVDVGPKMVVIYRRKGDESDASATVYHATDRTSFDSSDQELLEAAHAEAIGIGPEMERRTRERTRGTSDELEEHNIELIKQGIATYNRIRLHPALLEKFLSSTQLKLNTENK